MSHYNLLRFGHSMVQSVFRGTNQPWRLGKFYSDARFAFKDGGQGYANELEGLSEQACQRADLRVSEQLTQKLYCNNKVTFAIRLRIMIIKQRPRTAEVTTS